MTITEEVKALATSLGFSHAGIASAEPFARDREVILERLRQGLMDGLPWFHKARVRRGCDPQALLPGARSIIALALPYYHPEPSESSPFSRGRQRGSSPDDVPRGRVSRYAWSADYHKVMEGRVAALLDKLRGLGGGARFYVDYGPAPDRAIAARAGIGWHGKNTNILTTGSGSWVFLAEIITDLPLEPDAPLRKSCGRCTVCIPACPTGAIVAPYTLYNTRCISYHTIENRGVIPRDFRPLMGDWVFGCDICQDVCPVNDRLSTTATTTRGDPAFAPRDMEAARPDLAALLDLTEAEFAVRFRGRPVRRATWAGLLRNACIALGNSGSPAAGPPLVKALGHPAPLVRGHAAWALGRLGTAEARGALETALRAEADPYVREEIEAALAGQKAASL